MREINEAHSERIFCCEWLDEDCIATGSEDRGCSKEWDSRCLELHLLVLSVVFCRQSDNCAQAEVTKWFCS